MQAQLSSYISSKKKIDEHKAPSEVKNIKVPIPTFPPTAMVYSVPKISMVEKISEEDVQIPQVDRVSASIIAKILEERERERSLTRHCKTCTCSAEHNKVLNNTMHHVAVQTVTSLSIENTVNYLSGMKIKNTERKKNKITGSEYERDVLSTQLYSNEQANVVKVQPNNFLIDGYPNSNSCHSSVVNLNSDCTSDVDLLNANTKHNSYSSTLNENTECKVVIQTHNFNKQTNGEKHYTKISHHLEKAAGIAEKAEIGEDMNKVICKRVSNVSEDTKGPRYCSMRLQTGSKNILLDNAYSNISPVLYTRQSNSKTKKENTIRTHESNSDANSNSSVECVTPLMSSDFVLNNQRIADWIKNSKDYDISSSENSIFSPPNSIIENNENMNVSKYTEMEDNVKKFLFDKKFLKTVEIGKLKYQNLKEQDDASFVAIPKGETNRIDVSQSHIETEI